MDEIGIGAKAGVSRDFVGITPQHGACRGEQRLQPARIDRAGLQALGDDDLMRAIDRDLHIVTLHHAALDRQDAAVRVGEVTLCLVRRSAIGFHVRARLVVTQRTAQRFPGRFCITLRDVIGVRQTPSYSRPEPGG